MGRGKNNGFVCGRNGIGIGTVAAVYPSNTLFCFKNALVLFQKCPQICRVK
jgi:hypothetical protein